MSLISGSISSSLGTIMQNVTMSFFASGTATITYTAYTNTNGIYTQSVDNGWSGSLEPTASGYDFFLDYGVSGSFYFTASSNDRTLNWIGVKDFVSGSGTVTNPYTILDHEDMHNVRYRTGSSNFTNNVFYKLGGDIDLSPISEWYPINHRNGNFYGGFDGNGYTISNLNISAVPEDIQTTLYFGLFGKLSSPNSASYKIGNVTFNSCSINMLNGLTVQTTAPYYGMFAGYFESAVILEGIKLKNSTVAHRRTSGANVQWYAGGIIGRRNDGTILSCSVESSIIDFNVTTLTSNQPTVGLLVGTPGVSTIRYCYAKDSYINTNRNGDATENGFWGGSSTVYALDNYVLNCTVSGTYWVTPFGNTLNAASTRNYVAKINYGNTPIAQRYAFHVSSWTPTIGYNYWESGSLDLVNTGSSYIAGITGSLSASMQDSASYKTWDFVNIWKQYDITQYGYPYLSYEGYPGIKIIYPNGGELFFYNQLIPISWTFTSGTL